MRQVHGWAFPDADQFMATELKPDGTYQRDHLDSALRHVRDFSVAIDGGAHVGTWSKIMSERFDRVLAFEPSQDTLQALLANMATWECLNVEMFLMALGAAPGHVTMVLDGRAAELANTGGRYATPGGTVPVVTIDSFALPSLGLLKLDVEGSELAALEGAAETLASCSPIVLFEDKKLWKRHYGLRGDAPQHWLSAHGYRHLERAGCDEIWGPVQ